ncbi:ParB/RepB/Spo0J family partition protein [Fimbriiglobus ruber]|uniref:ParB/RepB/Spo0J family partition protein n=1 Tax=Fimbriiglobus ruber TaxID=1908690 RepID=UPI00137B2C06|nr:ParB/RepB/Spo0J family partition protein [Fimbriiglobus ruber]
MQTRRILTTLIDPNPANARRFFDDAGLAELAASLIQGQRVPGLVYAVGDRFTLLDGERRWRAARRAGLPDLLCCVLDKAPTAVELLLAQLAIDAHNVHLTPMERARLYADVMRETGLTATQLHEREGVSPATVTKYLSVFKCVPAVQDALAAGRIGITDVYTISLAPAGEQPALLAYKLAGATREAVGRARRTPCDTPTPAARVNRVKCQLPSGVAVVVSGEAISLDDILASLAEIAREAKRAKADGLDAKTFQAVLRDKARAGGGES